MKNGKMPSTMTHNFTQTPNADIPRSTFNRNHGIKSTFAFGLLIPILCDEVLPGDTHACNMSVFGRLSTPIVPVMDNMHLDYFFFFVPNRLIWSNWKKFNGEQINPGDSTSYVIPQIIASTSAPLGFEEASIYDFMGIPTKVPTIPVNALHMRAYNLIYNEWFRDQNLMNSAPVNLGDGPDAYTDYPLRYRCREHDYFTSALPWPQKGPTTPLIPLGSTAPVITNNADVKISSTTTLANVDWRVNTATNFMFASGALVPGVENVKFGNQSGLVADLTNAAAGTINQLRQAFQIQKLYERDARGGTRYTEIIKAHFGVTSPDARLQRPEYLGGGRTDININPVAQTSGTGASGTSTPAGSLSATGTTSGSGIGFTKSFTEHGVIVGLVAGRADLNYQQGLDRMWSRRTRFDFYWPALSHIGEQAILNQEIYIGSTPSVNTAAWGYQERYAEYRYKPSRITGQYRSNATLTLDIWHLAVSYFTLPALNANFMVDIPPIARILAVPTQPAILFDGYFNYKTTRPMPTYSVPGMVDHF